MGSPSDLNRCEHFPDPLPAAWQAVFASWCTPRVRKSHSCRYRATGSDITPVTRLQSFEIARFQPARSHADSGDSAPGERRNRSS